ncbi:endonuclease domain-containing protein [Microbacterium sp. C23T]
MPRNQFFSHVTAAVLWGLPLPSRILTDAFGRPRMLDVAVRAPLRHPRHDGVLGHQVKQGTVMVVHHATHGVPLTSPAFTWVMLAAVVRDHYDLVAVADGVVREQMFPEDPPPLGTLEQLESAVRSGRRVGIRALREALPRVRTRSASRMETRCRLILIDAGLTEPLLNHAVFDSTRGFIGVVDLAYPELRIAIEYEGEHHLRDPGQWAKDIARYEALANAGWFVIRVTKNDVFDGRAGLIWRVRSAVRSRR